MTPETPSAASASVAAAVPTDPTVVRRFPAGSKVVIKGLTGRGGRALHRETETRSRLAVCLFAGAVELNGQEGGRI